jgi:hypothetical protein
MFGFLDDILHEALRGRVLDHLGCHYVPAVLQHIASPQPAMDGPNTTVPAGLDGYPES